MALSIQYCEKICLGVAKGDSSIAYNVLAYFYSGESFPAPQAVGCPFPGIAGSTDNQYPYIYVNRGQLTDEEIEKCAPIVIDGISYSVAQVKAWKTHASGWTRLNYAGARAITVAFHRTPCDMDSCVECNDDYDCGPNQRCVDNECVDCEENQATHVKFRLEYDRVVTFDNATEGTYQELGIFPCSSSGHSVNAPLAHGGIVKTWVRGIACDSEGNPKNALALVVNGYQNRQSHIGPFNFYLGTNKLSLGDIYSEHEGDGWYRWRGLIEYIGSSEVLYETACGGEPDPEEPFTPPEIIEPPPEPEEPPDDEEPELIDEPLPPEPGNPPTPPQSGCECEIYLAQQLSYAIEEHQKQLSWKIEKLIVAIKNHTEVQTTDFNNFKNLFKTLFENLFENVAYNLELMRGYVSDINQQLMILQSRFLDDEEKNIAQIHSDVFHSTENPEMNITDVIENQPVPIIENEYRVSSERSVDFLDAYNDKTQE